MLLGGRVKTRAGAGEVLGYLVYGELGGPFWLVQYSRLIRAPCIVEYLTARTQGTWVKGIALVAVPGAPGKFPEGRQVRNDLPPGHLLIEVTRAPVGLAGDPDWVPGLLPMNVGGWRKIEARLGRRFDVPVSLAFCVRQYGGAFYQRIWGQAWVGVRYVA